MSSTNTSPFEAADANLDAFWQYQKNRLAHPVKVYVVAVEDHEDCGTIHLSVHASLDGATVALREYVANEYFRFVGYEDFIENELPTMTAEEIFEKIDGEEGKTAKVEEIEVLA